MHEEQFEEDPILKRIVMVIIGILLISLVLSYFLASYSIFPLIASLSESKVAKNKTIELESFSIIFEEETYKELQRYYHEDLSVEMAVCLKGKINKDYIIEEIYQPEIISQTFSHVVFRPCSSDTLILLHSQPFRQCIASGQDIKTLEMVKERNQNSIMIIMCEPDRFSVYR